MMILGLLIVRGSRLRLTNIVATYCVESALSLVYRHARRSRRWEDQAGASDEYFVKADFVIIVRHAENFLQSDLV